MSPDLDTSSAPVTTAPHVPLVVGAYASLPAAPDERALYEELLAALPGVRGLELPFRDSIAENGDVQEMAARLAPAWDRNVVTAIPGTMVRVWADPTFGLASVDPAGRQAALAFTRQVRDGVEDLREAAGRDVVMAVELHSAPSGAPGTDHLAEAFGESLAIVADWDWGGARLLVEHCDAYVAPDRGEKRMLTLSEEIGVVTELARDDVAMSLNWGRSALETRDANAPAEHVGQLREAGILAGLTFSGAGPVDTRYAKAWMDGHLPLDADEPGSVMSAALVRQCTELALSDLPGGQPTPYIGAKCQVPPVASPAERLTFLRHILEATGLLAPVTES
nr:DUF4862 family protein [Actinomyces sp.]